MKKIENYLEELKKITGSDYATAKAIGITRQSICMIKKGGGMSDETAIKVAEKLGIDPGEVLIAAAIERSEGEVKEAWSNLSKRAGIAASAVIGTIILAASLFGYDSKAYASEGYNNDLSVIYIMRSHYCGLGSDL